MMLKKSLHILISILLLITTTGISISAHYCGDNLRSVSFMSIPASCCDDTSCCHNETHFYQIDDDYTILGTGIKFLTEYQIINTPQFTESILVEADNNVLPVYRDIPFHPQIRSYLTLIQSFLL